ncbi:uncharacterized protein LOC144129743 [Amblyomma americanum]
MATRARDSVAGAEQPTVRGQPGRRYRRKKREKSPKVKKRRRRTSSGSENLACSIVTDSATLARDPTQSRGPEESPSKKAPAVSWSSVMPLPPTLDSTSASTPQSPKSPEVRSVHDNERGGCVCIAPETSTAEAVETATPTPLVSEAMTVSSAGDRSSGEHVYSSPTQKRSPSRGALTNVTFGAYPSSTPSPDPAVLAIPGALATGTAIMKSRSTRLRAISIAITHEPSTAETNIVPRALYRIGLLACALLSLAMLTFHWMAMPLLAPSVGHWCRKSKEVGNVSEAQWKRTFIPLGNDGRYSKCTVYSVGSVTTTDSNGVGSAGRPISAATAVTTPRQEVPCSSWEYDLSSEVKTLTSEWNLVCERRGLLFLAVIYNNIGGLVAMPIVGQMADRLGRWPVMVVSLLLALLAAIGTVFTSTFTTFVIARMLLTGSLSALALVVVLAMFEGYAYRQRQRSVCAAH